MEIASAQYVQQSDNPGVNACIKLVKTDGSTWYVPMKTGNTDYQAILEWVADGNTIQDAD